ncbi:hypothetical protein KCP76_15015 [Salmonella enterica subsp. enterica serovar Weltevreden]|nr:hypothetical protein KCP76_15015 [Salmonella enterica subsp. enterica serovar Weltevreden]
MPICGTSRCCVSQHQIKWVRVSAMQAIPKTSVGGELAARRGNEPHAGKIVATKVEV